MARIQRTLAVILCCAASSGCGTYVPDKNLLHADTKVTQPEKPDYGQSFEGRTEANIVGNIRCEIENGIYLASLIRDGGENNVPYLSASWATQVTLKLAWDETSSVTPGFSFIHPMSKMQSTAIGPGGSASAHATRVETVTFIFENAALVQAANEYRNAAANPTRALPDCSQRQTGTMINSDLKITDFIIDKATLASTGITTTGKPSDPTFSTFEEDLTFVGACSGNLTPSWKLTRFTANTSGNFLAATRTTTGDVLITLGPLKLTPDPNNPGSFIRSLGEPAASQHTASFQGGATATQVNSQTR
jgi:hypothetical protein